MVGRSLQGGGSSCIAFRYTPGQGTLALENFGGQFAEARSVNNAGYVVGRGSTGKSSLAARWNPQGIIQNLGVLSGDVESYAMSINNHNMSTGYSSGRFGPGRAVTWDSEGFIHAIPTNSGETWSYGTNVNDSGLVIDLVQFGEDFHPFGWTSALGEKVLLDVGDSRGEALGVNSMGMIVGDLAAPGASYRAVMWSSLTSAPVDLESLLDETGNSWRLESAFSVNDMGQIVGRGTFNGVGQSFIMTPVPAPGTCAMVAAGIICIARRRRNKPVV